MNAATGIDGTITVAPGFGFLSIAMPRTTLRARWSA
jgi:hypothetical protein